MSQYLQNLNLNTELSEMVLAERPVIFSAFGLPSGSKVSPAVTAGADGSITEWRLLAGVPGDLRALCKSVCARLALAKQDATGVVVIPTLG